MDYIELMEKAKEVSEKAYCPYSKFKVGACVLTSNNKIYCGCNFENSSYGLTICAERNAIGSAISDGETFIKAIAIYSPFKDNCTPCGACRQVLCEFGNPDTDVIVSLGNDIKIYKLESLIPESFAL